MASALHCVLGISILALATLGCDDGSAPQDGPNAVGSGGSGSGGTGGSVEGVPLTPTDGWVAVDTNILGIQGAMFSYADTTSAVGMTEDFTGTNACIKGEAAKVDLMCTPVAPATDCYGTFWGAAIGLNLNQPIDAATGMGVETPMPYDASAITAFSFDITGAAVPTSLRFKVEDASGEYCTRAATPVMAGVTNTFKFEDLYTECWTTTGTNAVPAKTGLLKIAWQVVTNDKATVPFDYCVSNVRAIQ